MRRYWGLLLLMGLGLIVATTITTWAGAEENEQEVTIDQVPAAVKATILKAAEGGTIKEIERETKNGTTVYEAEVILNGKEVEIKVAADGTLLGKEVEDEGDDEEDEDEVPISQIPQAAREALLKYARGAPLKEVEREKESGVELYEAEWKVNGREHEAKVTADGVLVELEEKVPAGAVPAAVRSAATKLFPNGTKVKFQKKTIVLYEVEAKVAGKEREVLISPTGKVLGENDDD